MTPPDGDHTATTFKWDILIKCGDPKVAEVGALWNPATTANGWFGSPDNVTFDADGQMWVATDQGRAWARTGKADGLYRIDTDGAARGTSMPFYRVPVGAELCGPCFTPDGTTLFVAVQHPGVDGAKEWKPFGREPTFEDPPTRWPDFKAGLPPRPSVVAIRKVGGGKIGS
jgi:secreted PhoX family phosphatase